MVSEFEQRLIDAARQQLAPDLQQQFENLDDEAQVDVALTMLSCADDLPPVFERKDLAQLQESVANLLSELGHRDATDHAR